MKKSKKYKKNNLTRRKKKQKYSKKRGTKRIRKIIKKKTKKVKRKVMMGGAGIPEHVGKTNNVISVRKDTDSTLIYYHPLQMCLSLLNLAVGIQPSPTSRSPLKILSFDIMEVIKAKLDKTLTSPEGYFNHEYLKSIIGDKEYHIGEKPGDTDRLGEQPPLYELTKDDLFIGNTFEIFNDYSSISFAGLLNYNVGGRHRFKLPGGKYYFKIEDIHIYDTIEHHVDYSGASRSPSDQHIEVFCSIYKGRYMIDDSKSRFILSKEGGETYYHGNYIRILKDKDDSESSEEEEEMGGF